MGYNSIFKDGVIHHIDDSALPKYLQRLQEEIKKEKTKIFKKFHITENSEVCEVKTGNKVSNISLILKFANGLSFQYAFNGFGKTEWYFHDNLTEPTEFFLELMFQDVFEPHQKLLKHIKVIDRTFTFDYQ